MIALLAALIVAAPRTEAIAPDGGHVPIVAPRLTPRLAPVLAPELTPDAGTVNAQPTLSVYDVDGPVEFTVTVGALSLFLVVDFFVKPTLEGDVSCRQPIGNGRCNPDDLTYLDRVAVGRSSEGWRMFGDVALVTAIAAPVIYLALESFVLPTTEPFGDWANDLIVISQAIAVSAAVQTAMKFAFRRPRPIRYQDVDEPLPSFDQELSFPSGHTTVVSAATTALTSTIFLRHPKSRVRFVVMGLGGLLTGLTAFSRVESGQHFPTDVLIGMMVGGFAGFAVPYFHRREEPITPSASFNPATGESSFGIAGTF